MCLWDYFRSTPLPKTIVCRIAMVKDQNSQSALLSARSVTERRSISRVTRAQRLYNLKNDRNIAILFDNSDKNNWKNISEIMFRGIAWGLKKSNEYMHAYKLFQKIP